MFLSKLFGFSSCCNQGLAKSDANEADFSQPQLQLKIVGKSVGEITFQEKDSKNAFSQEQIFDDNFTFHKVSGVSENIESNQMANVSFQKKNKFYEPEQEAIVLIPNDLKSHTSIFSHQISISANTKPTNTKKNPTNLSLSKNNSMAYQTENHFNDVDFEFSQRSIHQEEADFKKNFFKKKQHSLTPGSKNNLFKQHMSKRFQNIGSRSMQKDDQSNSCWTKDKVETARNTMNPKNYKSLLSEKESFKHIIHDASNKLLQKNNEAIKNIATIKQDLLLLAHKSK